MKKTIFLFLALFSAAVLSAVSFDGGEAIKVRDDLFYSEKELSEFSWSDRLTSEEESFYDTVNISLITGGRGSEIWEYFGHAAFLVETEGRESIMFDYGIFSFDEKFYINFALGKLYYSMMASYGKYRLLSLEDQDRDIYKLKLELNNIQKKNLIAFLEYNNQYENRTYLYDYYKDNCATRLRDLYNAAAGGEYREWAETIDTGRSFRDYTIFYLSPNYLASFAITYLLGPDADKDLNLYEAAFLPDTLRKSIEESQGTESTLLYKSESKPPVENNPHFYLKTALLALIASAISLLQYSGYKAIRKLSHGILSLIYFILGLMSIALLFLETLSIHKVAYMNTAILVISPFVLYFFFLHAVSLFRKERRKALDKAGFISAIALIVLLAIKLIFHRYLIEDDYACYILMIPLYISESITLLRQLPAKKPARVNKA